MSILALSQVWKHSKQESGALLVHLALADYADDDGFCYPSIAALMEKSRMGERSVQYAIRAMEESGELSVVEKGGITKDGGRRANTFRLNLFAMGAKIAPLPEGCKIQPPRVQNTTKKGAMGCTPTVIDPSIDPPAIGALDDLDIPEEPPTSFETKSKVELQNEAFETFWKAYPNKTGKPAAFKAFKPKLKFLAAIMAGLAKHKASEQWKREKGRFVPHPATFLNQDRFNDEPRQESAKANPSTPRPSNVNAGTANGAVARRY